MIRLIKFVFLACLAIVLATIAMANREAVTLTLLPNEMGDVAGMNPTVSLPLFIIVFGAIVAGLLIGFFWEWLREAKHRQEVSMRQQQVRDLKREVNRLKGKTGESDDDVLALLDTAPVKQAG